MRYEVKGKGVTLYAMKAYEGSGVNLQPFLILSLDRDERYVCNSAAVPALN